MEDVSFDKPVPIIGKDGKPIYVATAAEATHYLLNNWPDMDGPMHRLAREALHDLFIGSASARAARIAFEAAADEAELSVGGWHGNNPIARFLSGHRKSAIGEAVPRDSKRNRTTGSRS